MTDINVFMKPKVHTNPEISKDVTLPYRIYVPSNYDEHKKYGVLIFMHGAGERGSDNTHIRCEDRNMYFNYVYEDERYKDDFILIAPQCHTEHRWVEQDWSRSVFTYSHSLLSVPMKLFYDLLDRHIFKDYNVDMGRILMTGVSMGGFATWFVMMNRPELLAAAMPVCGGADPEMAENIKHIPTWIFHSDDDPVVPSASIHAMKKALTEVNAPDFHATLYINEGHGSWARAYLEKPAFDWFISRHK